MADLTRTIELLFTATNRTGSVFTSVGSGLDDLNTGVRNVAQPLADVTTAVVKLDAMLAAMAAGGIAYAFSQSSKLKSAFTELEKVAGDNAEALNDAKTNAKELSNAYGESAAGILTATAEWKQSGFDIQESMTLAKDSMDLVIAGSLDASDANEILIASLKGFKAPASDARRLIDILNEVSNQYATDIQQLGKGMAGLSPIAKQMGFSFEETAGILTPVIEVFRSGDEAAVALKTGLLKLIDDSKPVRDALESIGVSQKDANGNLRSGKDILADVSKAFQTLGQDQKLFVTQQLVGIEQSARMVEVFDGLSKSSEITAAAMNSAGSAAAEVAKRLKDPEVAVNRLREGFKNLSSAIGDDFQEAGTSVINGFTAIVNQLEKLVDDGAFEPILSALDDFLAGIGTTFEEVASALPEALEGVDYSGFLDSLGDIRDAVSGLFDNVDLTTPEGLQHAIQKIVDSAESLIRFSTGIAEVFVTLADKIGDLIGWFNSLDAGTITTAAKIAGIGAAVTAISVPVGAVASAIAGMGSAIAAITASPVLAVGAAVAGVASAGYLAGKAIYEWTSNNDDLKESLSFAKEVDEDIARIYAEADKVGPAFGTAGKMTKESALEIVKGVENASYSTAELTEELRKMGVLVEEKKTLNVDTAAAKEKFQELEYWVGDENGGPRQLKTIKVPIDTSEVEDAKKKIEEIPAVKRLEIETDLKIEEVKANAATVQKALEYKAQVDIAEIEAAAETTIALSDNISEMFADTGKMISGLFSEWDSGTSLQEKWAIQDQLKSEQELREKTLEMQKALNEAQVKYMEAKTRAIESGEALITVQGDSLAPHLEMIMWEVFAAIQIRATQEGLDQLLLGGFES